MKTLEENLLELLDGPSKELRDDNHVDPYRILVFDEETGSVEAIDLIELPLKYPVGLGGRWSTHDLGELVRDKALLYRQSVVAHEISDEDPSAQPTCGTVVLVVPKQETVPYRRIETRARIKPEQTRD